MSLRWSNEEVNLPAVIEAYGRGEIELEEVDRVHAGGRSYDFPGGKSYSLGTVARFLGWVKPSDGQATNSCRIAFYSYQKGKNEEAL